MELATLRNRGWHRCEPTQLRSQFDNDHFSTVCSGGRILCGLSRFLTRAGRPSRRAKPVRVWHAGERLFTNTSEPEPYELWDELAHLR